MKIRFNRNKPLTGWHHGPAADPATWPWWRKFYMRHCHIETWPPTTGHRFSIYTRRLWHFWDVTFDRREAELIEPMLPVSPYRKLPELTIAKYQPEYRPLPCYRDMNGVVTVRWKLPWRARWRALFGGCIWSQHHTLGGDFQPINITDHCPVRGRDRA